MTELWRLGALALNDGYRRKDFDPVDAVQACLARVSACQGAVNAMLHVDDAGALAAARASAGRWSRGEPLGPLDGVPVSLKDNLHAADMPTTWGSRLLDGYVAPRDELPVARLRASGAVMFGKTMLPEFALQGITENLIAGATRNPWDLARTPGGSSGGAAAAVACGMGPLAFTTDGGGSTRRPASHTGVIGFKPGADWIARGGGLPEIFLDFEQPGLMARSVADVRAFAHALAGDAAPPASPKAARILFVRTFADHPVDTGISKAVERAASQLASLGHAVTDTGSVDWAEAVNDAWPSLSNAGLAWMLANASRFPELGQAGTQPVDLSRCGTAARENAAHGGSLPATALFDALAAVRTLRAHLRDVFARHEFILTPATAAPAWLLGETHPRVIANRPAGPRGHAVFTAFANAAGLPAIALPGGLADGLPVGFQLVARRGAEPSLLALALSWEQAFPRGDVWPPEPSSTMGAT